MNCGRIIDCEQGTPEWHAARCGRLTGSRIADILRQTKSGPSKMRDTYMGELVAERLSGVQDGNGFTSAAMQWGKDTEPLARRTYAFLHDVNVQQIGFVVHPTIEMAGASPDSFVGEHGGLEIKCPNSKTHIDTLLGAPIDPDYIKQMNWNMACTGRAWWDFVSFDPRLPAEMQIVTRRVMRDDTTVATLNREVSKFVAEVDALVAELRAKFPSSAEAA